MLTAVGAGAGAPAAGAAPAAAGGAPAAASEEAPAEKKEEAKEECVLACWQVAGRTRLMLFDPSHQVRRRHGFRSFRLNVSFESLLVLAPSSFSRLHSIIYSVHSVTRQRLPLYVTLAFSREQCNSIREPLIGLSSLWRG
jgi:hypothetical protein